MVFAAAMLHDFENVVGIELLSSLNSVAKKVRCLELISVKFTFIQK